MLNFIFTAIIWWVALAGVVAILWSIILTLFGHDGQN